MSHTEISNQSWFSRLGGAFKGIVFGGLLFLVAFPLQFWNEGRAVRRIKTLAEGKGAVIADVSPEKINSSNDHKLVHMVGEAKAIGELADERFGVTTIDALKLKREVEMYQWHEDVETRTTKKTGGGKRTEKTYSYYQDWSGSPIDSSEFHESRANYGDGNPPMPFQSETVIADKIMVGAFHLNDSLVSMIAGFEAIDVSGQIEKMPGELKDTVQPFNGGFYFGTDPANPQIGDVRVQFEIVKPSTISFISEQTGETFRPYSAKSVSGTIERLEMGQHGVDEMFAHMENENTMLTWLLRAVGLILMVVGIGMILAPLAVAADVIPFVGNIVGAGTWLIALMIGSFFSLTTVSIAWIVYRPLIGISLLAVALVIGLFVYRRTATANSDDVMTEGVTVVSKD